MSARRSRRPGRWFLLCAAAVTGTVLGATLGGRSALLPAPAAADSRPTVTVTATVAPRPHATPSETPGTSSSSTSSAPPTTVDAVSTTRPDCPAPAARAITAAPGTGRTIALTFDDGPGEDTEALLAVLREHDVHATFFMVGNEAAAHPDLVAAVAADGHLIGDHSWDHRYPQQVTGGWTASWLKAGMTRTNDAVADGDGGPVCWFRPPGGFMPKTLLPAARAQGMSVVLWSIDPEDWKLEERNSKLTKAEQTDEIVERVTAGIGTPHPLVLMHDGGGDRKAGVAAVGEIIDRYQAAGYRFVRIDGQS